jgi:magnesium chelatase subunit I
VNDEGGVFVGGGDRSAARQPDGERRVDARPNNGHRSANGRRPRILPYSWIIGQDAAKTALELSFIEPRIGGVLISGQRGTAKSTVARSFNLMMTGSLPVTLPINATDDRIVGTLDVPALLEGEWKERKSLLQEAGLGEVLYVDEVNLLDDHIVNLLLDVVSTGQLVVAHAVSDLRAEISFHLVGTMNPEEGSLRPQLLDRFGLLVEMTTESSVDVRARILDRVLEFDQVHRTGETPEYRKALDDDRDRMNQLREARDRLTEGGVVLPETARLQCARVAAALDVVGHRGDVTLARAAQAYAARRGAGVTEGADIQAVARFVLPHRRGAISRGGAATWSEADEATVRTVIDGDA